MRREKIGATERTGKKRMETILNKVIRITIIDKKNKENMLSNNKKKKYN